VISTPYMLFLGACFLGLVYGILRSHINETEDLAQEYDNPDLRLSPLWYTISNLLPGGVVVCLLVSGSLYLMGVK